MNSIKNSTKFKDLVRELASRLFRRKLKEITTTASIDTYQTPYAFSKKGMKKKRKKNIEKQTGYKFVDESISKDDLKKIKMATAPEANLKQPMQMGGMADMSAAPMMQPRKKKKPQSGFRTKYSKGGGVRSAKYKI